MLERYRDVGLVDDEAFARAWVSSRHHGRGLARRALAHELSRKGVAPGVADDALAELDDDTQLTTARALVVRRLRTERPGQRDATFRRLVGLLARKGYPAGVAIGVVKEAMAEWTEATAQLDEIDLDVLAAEAETAAVDEADSPGSG